LRSAFGKVVAVTALISMPAAFGILAVSNSLVYVAFGEQWMPAAPILAVLALVGMLDAINTLVEPVLMARGALKSLSHVLMAHAAVLIPSAVFLVSSMGAIGAAYAMLISSLVAMCMYYVAGRKEIRYTFRELARYLWRPFAASVAMAGAVRWLETFLVADATAPTISILFGLVSFGVLVYAGALSLFWLLAKRPEFPEVMLLETATGYLKSRFSSRPSLS
jgi:O-antigen/teichoic acid export membrane protein